MLSEDDRIRYARQIQVGDFGEAAQEKLKKAKVAVVGTGGLGSAASIYLAAAGIGTLRLIDYDKIELSNLNRQILHWNEDIGREKVISAQDKLSRLNPGVKVEIINKALHKVDSKKLFTGCDVIVDGLDNLESRYILNKAAISNNIPLIHGAVYGFEGRVLSVVPGKTACLKCIYRGTAPEKVPPVIGVMPGIIGCIQAAEAIKYITGIGNMLLDRLLICDGRNMKFTEMAVRRNKDCEHCGDK